MSNPAAQTFNRIPLPQLPLLPFDFLAENDHSVQTHSTSVQPSLSFVTTSLQSSRSTLDIAGSSKYQTLVYGDGKLTSSNTSFLSTEQNNLHDALTATDPSTIQKAPNRARDWFTRWFVEWWLMEIMSWLFGAVCMVIIATVLSKYDGKPDPRWKIGLSMSAFISIFSGFAKSALLLPTAEALGQLKWDWFRRSDDRIKDFERLDSASRGAWGSLILLVRTRKVSLATIGAAVILLSLPLDGFFQRIVTYPLTAVNDSTNATISRTIFYDADPEQIWSDNRTKYSPDSQLDSFIYPYWQGKGVVPGVAFNCPTGNCTYDPFYTLAFDFQCKPLSKLLEFGCRNASAEWMIPLVDQGAGKNPTMASCGWYMDPGPEFQLQLMSGYEITDNGTIGAILATRFFPIQDLVSNRLAFGGSPNFKNIQAPVTDFILASTPGGFDGAIKNNTPILTECEIHWVVNLLNATVLAGILEENLIEILQFESNLTGPYAPWDGLDGSDYMANFSMTLRDPHAFTPDGMSTFGLDNITAFKVFQAWEELAQSALILPINTGGNKDRGHGLKMTWWRTPPSFATVINSASPILPWDTPNNVTEHMAEAVTVMNQVIRRSVLSRSHRHDVAVGQAWKYVQLVKVNWAWITMPLALLMISGAFLLATVVRTSDDKAGTLKTSGISSLFNSLQDDENGNARRGYTSYKMDGSAIRLVG